MTNKPLYLDIHALQSVPPSCINRDDTGSPKTARFGGVMRARVSSQAWKKAVRDEFATMLDEKSLGQRTVHAVDLVADRIRDTAPDIAPDEAQAMAVSALKATGINVGKQNVTGYLLFFTAMDDRSPEDTAGAGMIGTVEYLSATFYRYATLDIYHLCENLGSAAATVHAIEAFCTAFVRSMPTGKQNTFANRTLPSAVVMQLRDTQPVSLVNAFERPVYAQGDQSLTQIACERLVEQERFIDEAFGTKPRRTYAIVGSPYATAIEQMADEASSLDQVIQSVCAYVSTYLASRGMADQDRA